MPAGETYTFVERGMTWLFLALSVILALKHRQKFTKSVNSVLLYVVIGAILSLALSANQTYHGVTLQRNLDILWINLIEFVRDGFFAAVGLTLYKALGLQPIIDNWEDSFVALKKVPLWVIAAIVIGDFLYSSIIFSAFHVRVDNPYYANQLITVAMGAFAEEMWARMFLMGLVLYVCRKLESRWLLAIVVSTLYWSFIHLGPGMEWVKVLQVFPFGLALGWLMKKYGFETSVFTHLLANFLLVTLPPI